MGISLGAHADFLFSDTGGSTGTVVQFESKFSDSTFFPGDTNVGANTVDFLPLGIDGMTMPSELIGTTGLGQADVICTLHCNSFAVGGANGHQLTGLEIKFSSGFAATTLIGNLDFGEGSAQIVAQDQFGNAFVDDLKSGQNFFRIDSVAGSGEVLTDVKIFEFALDPMTMTFGWNDFKQPRIEACVLRSGDPNACPTATSVPEPGMLAILGTALSGMWYLHRRRRA
jgi:hypothetical protein